jgi:oxygen-independent coproporphyrinogen III oxidase
MSGIYIHIPFCKQACYYCDFYFSTSLKTKDDFVEALLKEIALQKDYFEHPPLLKERGEGVRSIYFGGGTPSLLSSGDIKRILDEIEKYHNVAKDAEITLEANPDDLDKEKLLGYKEAGINRLSIGIQSFADEDLKLMNRAHNSKQAHECVYIAAACGFTNITIDLIYGIQTLSNEQWIKNLETAFSLPVNHLSCYSLTVEERTALADFIRKGKLKNVDDEKASQQFDILIKMAADHDFEQYEISNFARLIKKSSVFSPESSVSTEPDLLQTEDWRLPTADFLTTGYYSRHNTSYWLGEKYLGLGPSAHSYDGDSRQWNVRNNHQYIEAIRQGRIPLEKEVLTPSQKFNEYVMVSLRTMWGCNLEKIKKDFGEKAAEDFFKEASAYIRDGLIETKKQNIILTHKGKFYADKIASELFQ